MQIKENFANYGFNLSEIQEKQFEKYYETMIETNKVLNLTAITDKNEVILKHFIDSVFPVTEISKNSTVVDVGTGAGFPGLPLKILRPDLQVFLVDSLNKRVKFLKETIGLLNLKNITADHFRAEDYAKNNREKFDYAVARAVAGLNTLVEYLLPLIKVGGKAIIYKSTKLDEELFEAKKAITVLGGEVESIQKFLLNGDIERNILILKKINKTPLNFPRDKNRPKINPIKN